MDDVALHQGDCLDVMPTIPDQSIDCIICDPPYPCVDRPYGRMTEAEWDAMMRRLIPECRRVLKPSGSAVFILQPNSERAGRMRPWLWEFLAWTCREWGQVQDAWWWNYATPPLGGAPHRGLMRPSLKACAWLGPEDCHRDQDAVLWSEADSTRAERLAGRRANDRRSASHHRVGRIKVDRARAAAAARGGVTPFNVLPIDTGGEKAHGGGAAGHAAATPRILADWWIRYISPAGGVVLDPFAGSATIPLAAWARGRRAIGIERDPGYVAIARARIAAAALPLLDAPPRVVPNPSSAPAPVRPPLAGQLSLFAEEPR